MVFSVIRRVATILVLCFATLGFLAVPVGEKTGYEHAASFLATDEVQTLLETVRRKLPRLDDEIQGEAQEVGTVTESRERVDPRN